MATPPAQVKEGQPVHARSDKLQDAIDQVNDATKTLQKARSDSEAADFMRRAKAVLVLVNYGRGGLIVGGGGGSGVLLLKENNAWVGPALYNVGTINIGLQAGAEGGSAIMFLMSQRAVDEFKKNNNIDLNADSGLTVVGWSARAQGKTGGDAVMWSNAKGLYAGATVGLTDINYDEEETAALYGKSVTFADILNGKAQPPHQAASLTQALPKA